MKRIIALISAAMLTLCLVGCGSSGSSNSSTNAASSSSSQSASAPSNFTYPETTLVDNDSCRFTIKSINIGSDTEIKAELENKTANTELMFSFDEVTVNGYACEPFWAESVAAGKKATSTIRFSRSALAEIGASSPDRICFTLRIYDNQDWTADAVVKDVFVIYPTGLTEEQVVTPERRTTSTENVVVNDDNCSFVILDVEENGSFGYTINCFLENKTNETAMFSWDNVSVNGYMVDPFWASSVPANSKAYASITFSKSKFEENSITEVTDIEYTLSVYNYNDYMAGDYVEATFTYTPAK